MEINKPKHYVTVNNLKDRVDRFFNESKVNSKNEFQFTLDFLPVVHKEKIEFPTESLSSFLNFITAAVPTGELYIFGGVLRDLALLGRKGFNSDIDLVVEGDWSSFVKYLTYLNAKKNKFGGYRLMVGKWPVDVWNAEETWAIKEGLIPYKGIASLTETTVLNWDAILMNWRSKKFIFRENYFEDINSRVIDVILEENPNPIGMAVRVFRNLYIKEAMKIRESALNYLTKTAKTYSFEIIRNSEIQSYGEAVISKELHRFFEEIDTSHKLDIPHQFCLASRIVKQELTFS